MNFRNISAWSIRNPIIPLVFFTGLLFAGILSFMRMDVVNQPDIDFPAVQISISQPGAAPTEIENQITQRIEAAVRSINGVKNISSTASEGSSSTFVEFEIGTDTIEAVNEVKNSVDQIRGSLPEGILEPSVTKVDATGEPIAYFAVEADDMTIEQLSWFVDDTVTKRLLAIDGMAEVDRFGGVDREIRVVLDPARMQALGVTASVVNNALRQINVDAAGGRADVGGTKQSLRVLGNADTAFELSQMQVPLGGGRTIKLTDVATVTDGFGEPTSISKVRNKEVVNFAMTRSKGASDVTVYDEAVKAMDELKAQNPGVRFIRLGSSVDYTKGQYESSIASMIEGAVLAVVVVFFFLRDWRATIISAIAIPLSAIPTFWFMDLLGFNLNFLSLLALGLVAGVLVDDAIVEIENIVRHMRMGKSAYQASIDAADEIGLAVVATSFCIVAVFLPVGLMPGISGQFFKNFGITVVVSVLMSLAVARMITPMVAAYFLEAKGHAAHGEGKLMDRYMRLLDWSLDKSRAQAFRGEKPSFGRKLVSMFLDHRMWMMGVGLLAFLITIVLFASTPAQFQPTTDEDNSRIQIEMVPGTTLEQTEVVADKVAAIMYQQPEVELALIRIREGNGTIFVTLKKEREKTSIEFERNLAKTLQSIPDARVTFASQSGGGGTNRDISVMLTGSNPDQLYATAGTLVEQMKGLKQVTGPRVNADMRRPEIIIKPRADLAAQLGITTAALSQAIRIATLGEIEQNAAKFSLSDRQIQIRVVLPKESRNDFNTIQNLPVQTAAGGSVPLSRVADISFGSGPTTIQRYNQERRVFIGVDLAPGVVTGEAMTAINNLPIMKNLPTGVGNKPFGEQEWQAELAINFVIALVSGVLLVFAVLVLLYKRLMSPLVNMGSLALAPLGGIFLIWVLGQPLSMPVLIGVLMLLGIVSKNSILLIDFAIEEMQRGVPKLEAILEAGHKRAQPIVMTTVAMTAGMVPTALSLSGDGAWRAPMGIVVIGGLIVSTLLTLIIVPAGFSLADGVEKRVGPWLRTKFLTYKPGDNADDEALMAGGRPHGIQPAE
ncbi:MAG: efflux RND transporter permease subunit [Blastomonas fulva]|jgi:multidrug efflux pump subunit AcrB|uniref:ABC transporter permease n=1 Tax=Blastomonas fulva TaxID=1550728 RepID=A0ABM6MBD1_9SPHN|nr:MULTISPECIES: efflux RND transporter permease subunit [Blastomonas]AOG01267.1 acrB/AcrD/AcrF family protein [Blastomonas sp. RAC04]ASR53209.1 ABC transporter permease [Blastomonas fulva]MCO5792852.1 efflux RND transporter permease subunit [Blastomonas sp.]MDM7927063.1 efflux RND transporter permease subunit [Blastomonas fulva]MDM7966943.1 efflux RND transporter permease subunit [Blastomonas fulva]